MSTSIDVEKYMDLLVHRRDVFAQQHANGTYTPVRAPITDDDIVEHLAGFASYGVYVVNTDNTVKYIVFDLDVRDEQASDTLCQLVQDELCHPDVIGAIPEPHWFLREFSGNKGTHVWLFLSEPVPAEKVRRWVAADFMPKWQEIAGQRGWPTALEVFPKQDTVPEGGFGNLVKLPLGVHQVSGERSQIVGWQDWPTSVDEVVPLSAQLVPERERLESGRTGGRRERVHRSSPASPFPCVDQIMREGVGQGVRDNAMFHLALYFYGHGIDQDVALELCQRANENFDPPLTDREVEQKVSSAYRGTYESARCGVGWLADICPGPCRSGWHVNENATGGELRSATPGATVEVEVLRVQQDGPRRRVTVGHPDADNTPTFAVRSTA